MNLNDYVQTPQNDLHHLNLIIAEYSAEPAICLAHGIQKDSIQNGSVTRSIASGNNGFNTD